MSFFVITGIGAFIILLIIEYRILHGLIYAILRMFQRRPPAILEDGYLDVDVHNENQRINSMANEEIANNNLVLNKVSKYYGSNLAVNQLSIGIQE